MYDTLKNRLGDTPFGAGLMVELIQEKHNNSSEMQFYYDSTNVLHVSTLEQAYKEQNMSHFIIMNGDMKGDCNKMLHNQMICGTKPFNITWGHSMSLLDCESTKTRMQCNKNNKGGGKQDNKDGETNGIVKCLLGADSDIKDQYDNDGKSAVPMDAEGNESPSQVNDGDTKLEEPNNDS